MRINEIGATKAPQILSDLVCDPREEADLQSAADLRKLCGRNTENIEKYQIVEKTNEKARGCF